MDGVDDLHVRVALDDLEDGVHDILHGLAVVFAAVAGDGDDAPMREVQMVEQLRREGIVPADGILHGVDGRVAGDEDFAHNGLTAQIFRVGPRRREVQIGDVADQRPVHFLREGRILVPCAKSCLNVADLDLMVEGCQRTGEGRGGVAVDQNEVGLRLLKHLLHAEQGLGRDRGERLALFHDIEVIIALEMENIHHGVQHFAVLAGQADDAFDAFAGLKRAHERRHFDRLRPGAENGHDFDLIHEIPPAVPRPAAPRRARPRERTDAASACGRRK